MKKSVKKTKKKVSKTEDSFESVPFISETNWSLKNTKQTWGEKESWGRRICNAVSGVFDESAVLLIKNKLGSFLIIFKKCISMLRVKLNNLFALRIKVARWILRRAFKKDPAFREIYVANIAMCLFDKQQWNEGKKLDFNNLETRNDVADYILNIVFKK